MERVGQVSPREYRSERRDAASRATRQRIVEAALAVVTAEGGVPEFTMEAVARRAGISRMTLYYQFGSRSDLINAMADELAERSHIVKYMGVAFRRRDALATLDGVVDAFMRLWAVSPVAMRRLRSLAVVDPALERDIDARDDRRRNAVNAVVDRLIAAGTLDSDDRSEAIETLCALLSFEVWDQLGGRAGRAASVAPLVKRLIRRVIGLRDP
jgi:AcrR family transcriptional regulator